MLNDQPLNSGGNNTVPDPPVLCLTTKTEDQDELHRFSFAGHLLADEDHIKSGLVYSILKSAWRLSGGLEVHEQSKNTFIFILSDGKEKDRIFRESPWFVKGSHIILKDWPDSQRFDEISFSHSAFWVQVHGLPKGCMTLENIQIIGSLFPRLISWDKSVMGGVKSFLRLQVELDVHIPLLSGFQFRTQEDEVCSAEFKYEKLVDFCYRCGMLGHTKKTCTDFRWTDDDGNPTTQSHPQYGPHMRAPAYSPRKHFGSIHEAKHNLWVNAEALAMRPQPGERKDSREEAAVEGRVNQYPPQKPPTALMEGDLSHRGIITLPAGRLGSSSASIVTPMQHTPPLNAMETSEQDFLSAQPLDTSSTLNQLSGLQLPIATIQTEPEMPCQDFEMGLLLSEQIETHLSLGKLTNRGTKRKTDFSPLEQIFERTCIRDTEASGLQCSPRQLQQALAQDRPEFHVQDQLGFFSDVDETITVRKVRRRLQQKALARQVRFQPDARSLLFQDFHPTQLSFNDPPFIPVAPLVNTLPGFTSTHFCDSPSTETEQFFNTQDTDGASVAAPWKPPSPT
ncbi:hypothetical protein SLEP1_g26468 [Rubroshorea leprosula]|uniref:CCHC-type domain-containing protein n=1 Tax=Rubroshorea leprosula TaxID=152421 RepID=A0AAV5JTE3_9ROSI|nr:hypothetical protein SLEP1_g26468 [Rubroshorea leprosula]